MELNSASPADSGNQSKRNLNSAHSNSSNNSMNNNKENKRNQKTLGMVWGSSSCSSLKSSFRCSPFSNFGSYMVVKNQKLQDQFDAEASNSSHSGLACGNFIFQGVAIFVDGFTVPSSQELRGYMLKYGGRFENYFSRRRVTHIICSNLPDSKIKNLRSFSGGLPVVKPTWVLDSVAANKLLSWVPYQIDQLANGARKQPKLSSFFATKKRWTSDIEESTLNANGDTVKDADMTEVLESVDNKRHDDRESDSYALKEPMEVKTTYRTRKAYSADMEGSLSDTELENSVKQEGNEVHQSSIQHRSTLEDPNFVENYFKNSRLHFIGTWRNRYHKQFPSMSKKGTFNSPECDTSAISQKIGIIHVDMDCFFVSVVIRNNPDLWGKPVAVCHSDNPRGTAEISSANYPARDYGIRAGIFVKDAKALCPDLVILPYNFGAYEEVADQFYNILHKHCNKVKAVSCDEAFLEVTDSDEANPELLASIIRKEIFEKTKCTASAGIAENMLLARLATRTAKPNGQCCIPSEKVYDYLSELPVKSLPGIGHALNEKLKNKNIYTCGQMRLMSKESLQKDFGMKTGEMLWAYSRGIDNQTVGAIQETKSVGAEINWGIRFKNMNDCQHLLFNLCKEVALRLQGCGVQGRTFTLKIKKRKQDAGEPIKYMGCGDCENLSHSMTVPLATNDVEVLQRIIKQLFGAFHVDVKDIRGVGLQVSRVESADTSKLGNHGSSLRSWLMSTNMHKPCDMDCSTEMKPEGDAKRRCIKDSSDQPCTGSAGPSRTPENSSLGSEFHSEVPPLYHLDVEVIESLPPELFSEINDIYGGKVLDFIAKRKAHTRSVGSSACISSDRTLEGTKNGGDIGTHCTSLLLPSDKCSVEVEAKGYPVADMSARAVSGAGSSAMVMPASHLEKNDLMPLSLSQVDDSVLQQLPEELRVGILEQLPPHRMAEPNPTGNLTPCGNNNENSSEKTGFHSDNRLLVGDPPMWVGIFKVSDCLVLKILSEMHYRSGAGARISSILQNVLCEPLHLFDLSSGWDQAICSLCELLKQYIELKLDSDIEEIYLCFRLLKRIATKSSFFGEVYNIILPYLQMSIGEKYGGSLRISLSEG